MSKEASNRKFSNSSRRVKERYKKEAEPKLFRISPYSFDVFNKFKTQKVRALVTIIQSPRDKYHLIGGMCILSIHKSNEIMWSLEVFSLKDHSQTTFSLDKIDSVNRNERENILSVGTKNKGEFEFFFQNSEFLYYFSKVIAAYHFSLKGKYIGNEGSFINFDDDDDEEEEGEENDTFKNEEKIIGLCERKVYDEESNFTHERRVNRVENEKKFKNSYRLRKLAASASNIPSPTTLFSSHQFLYEKDIFHWEDKDLKVFLGYIYLDTLEEAGRFISVSEHLGKEKIVKLCSFFQEKSEFSFRKAIKTLKSEELLKEFFEEEDFVREKILFELEFVQHHQKNYFDYYCVLKKILESVSVGYQKMIERREFLENEAKEKEKEEEKEEKKKEREKELFDLNISIQKTLYLKIENYIREGGYLHRWSVSAMEEYILSMLLFQEPLVWSLHGTGDVEEIKKMLDVIERTKKAIAKIEEEIDCLQKNIEVKEVDAQNAKNMEWNYLKFRQVNKEVQYLENEKGKRKIEKREQRKKLKKEIKELDSLVGSNKVARKFFIDYKCKETRLSFLRKEFKKAAFEGNRPKEFVVKLILSLSPDVLQKERRWESLERFGIKILEKFHVPESLKFSFLHASVSLSFLNIHWLNDGLTRLEHFSFRKGETVIALDCLCPFVVNYQTALKRIREIAEHLVFQNINTEYCDWTLYPKEKEKNCQSFSFGLLKSFDSSPFFKEIKEYLEDMRKYMIELKAKNTKKAEEAKKTEEIPCLKFVTLENELIKKMNITFEQQGEQRAVMMDGLEFEVPLTWDTILNKTRILIRTHKELDNFYFELEQRDPYLEVHYPGLFYLLKGFDRAFWMVYEKTKTEESKRGKICRFSTENKNSLFEG